MNDNMLIMRINSQERVRWKRYSFVSEYHIYMYMYVLNGAMLSALFVK